jgi:3-hydroxymyristoyl/3-hydroxydecanoyl-(acyl carrier protein) dehydratase
VTYVSELQCVDGSHSAFPGHFPQAPIVPGAWLLTLVEDFCRGCVSAEAAVASVDFVRFRQPLLPDQPFRIHLTVEAEDRIRFLIERDGAPIADGRLALRIFR